MFIGTSIVSAAQGSITKTLKYGMKDIQVKYLQQFLNEKGYLISRIGAGSDTSLEYLSSHTLKF